MASSFCRRPRRLLFSRFFFFNPPSLQPTRRHSHTSVLWEQLLGRKYEPSLAKALHDAVSQYKASQSVPSWLPFLPNSSFWVPSSEESAKCLQDLADRLNESDPDSDSESDIGCSSCISDPSRECFHESLCLEDDDDDDDDYVDDDDEDEDDDEEDGDAEIRTRISAVTAFQVTDKLLDIHRKSPIQQGTTVVLLDHFGGAGDVIDDTTEDDEDDYTDEVVVIDSTKE